MPGDASPWELWRCDHKPRKICILLADYDGSGEFDFLHSIPGDSDADSRRSGGRSLADVICNKYLEQLSKTIGTDLRAL